MEAPKTLDEAIKMLKLSIAYLVKVKMPIKVALASFKTAYTIEALETFGNKSKAAKEIGYHRNSFIRNLPRQKKMPQMARSTSYSRNRSIS